MQTCTQPQQCQNKDNDADKPQTLAEMYVGITLTDYVYFGHM